MGVSVYFHYFCFRYPQAISNLSLSSVNHLSFRFSHTITMYTSIFTLALLSTSAFAAPEKRQATNGQQFTNAAGQLISAYLPTSVKGNLASIISDAAAKASVTGDAVSLISSALLANDIPGWFTSAIPSAWSSQFAALESGIDALRGTVGATDLVDFVVPVTRTDSAGSTFTTDITTTVPASLT